jgi:hypothetical protein
MLAEAGTVGLIYDEIDGLNFYNDYGMLRELFADPALAVDKRYSEVLRGYLGADAIGLLPIRRLALAHRRQPTRCSARCCASPTSPGPTTVRHYRGAGRPGTTSTSRARASR